MKTCVREGIKKIAEAREVLKAELSAYNGKRVHSTTGEIPNIRFERALLEKQSLFRDFKVTLPFLSAKDIFCLRGERIVDGYRKLHYLNQNFKLPNFVPRQKVNLKIYPDPKTGITEVRFWHQDKFLGSQKLKK